MWNFENIPDSEVENIREAVKNGDTQTLIDITEKHDVFSGCPSCKKSTIIDTYAFALTNFWNYDFQTGGFTTAEDRGRN